MDATTSPAITQSSRPMLAVVGFVVLLVMAAGMLWWRYGEGVFAQSIMSAIMACF